MTETPFILAVEDHQKIRAHLILQLREQGFAVDAVPSAEEALRWLTENQAPDLLLVDVRLPKMSGIDLVRQLLDQHRLPPTIVISGEASISETVEALRLGVYDFIEKPFTRERLLQSVRNCLDHAALGRQLRSLAAQQRSGDVILGTSRAILDLQAKIERVAPTSARVLIRGETGTGKELVATTIHRLSGRLAKPFIKVNCAAIPANLIESELFGHVRGAFTDARNDRRGLFEEADGGTLFLDEIGDMNMDLQGRLLRVLEEGKVRRIGDATDRDIDVRVIAATNRNLEEMIRRHAFREDLFFRLSAVPIIVPPLREHPEDIAVLFSFYLDAFARRNGRRPLGVEPEVFAALRQYAWPGNVRQLKNAAEQVAIFASDPVTVAHLPSSLLEESNESSSMRHADTKIVPLREFKSHSERDYIESVLRRANWNVSAAARMLEIQRSYLHQKIADLGIERGGGAGKEGS